MKKGVGKTVQARQLGRHLRELRKEAGVGVDTAAREIGVSDATLYRFESGTSVPRPPDVKALCAMYGADADITDALLALGKEANTPGWWHSYDGRVINPHFAPFIALEGAAEHLRVYESEIILGLLQTRRYAEALFRLAVPSPSEEEIERRFEVRKRRQLILERRNPPRLDVILGEAALVKSPGDDIMVEQLGHLDEMSRRPNVTLRVVPVSVMHCGLNCARFMLLRSPADRRGLGEPPLVYTDVPTGALYLSKPEELEVYEGTWNAVLQATLPPPESRELVNDYRKRYQR